MIAQLRKIASIIERRDYALLSIYLFIVLASTVLEAGGIGLVFAILQTVGQSDFNEAGRLVHFLRDIFGGRDRYDFLVRACAVTFVVFVLRSIGVYAAAWAAQELRAHIHLALAVRLIRNYLFAPYAWLLTQSPTQLFTNITNNVAEVSRNCVLGVLDILAAVILIAVFSIGAIAVRPLEMTIVIGALTIVVVGYFRFLRDRFAQWGAASVAANFASARAISEPLEAIKALKIMGLESYFVDKYAALVKTHMRLLTRHTLAQNTPRLVLEVLLVAGVLSITVATATTDPSILAVFLLL